LYLIPLPQSVEQSDHADQVDTSQSTGQHEWLHGRVSLTGGQSRPLQCGGMTTFLRLMWFPVPQCPLLGRQSLQEPHGPSCEIHMHE